MITLKICGIVRNMRRIDYVKVVGCVFLLAAFFFNPFVVEQLFCEDKNIERSSLIVRIVIFELIVGLIGVFFVLKSRAILRLSKEILENKREIFLIIVTTLLLAILLEVGSRVYVCKFASPELQSEVLYFGECGVKSLYSPHHYLNYYGTPDYKSLDGLNMHNSIGFRGPEVEIPKPKGVYRIATIGGSTTYTIAVKDWHNDFARQLEKELQSKYNYDKIEVVNVGLGGWNSWESLINLEFKVLDLDPDLIVIYHGVNDVHARLVDPLYYKGDNSGRRRFWGPKEDVLVIFRSTFVRLVTGLNPWRGISSFVDVQTLSAANETHVETLQKNRPVYFERNLRNMIAIAREHNVNVLLATWAYSNQLNDYTSTSHYEMGIAENNEVVVNVGLAHDVSVFDFAVEMPKDKIYWADGRHLNEEGARLKGELFAKFIYLNRLIDDEIEVLRNGE